MKRDYLKTGKKLKGAAFVPVSYEGLLNLSTEHAAIYSGLSKREKILVYCMGRGMQDKDIAQACDLKYGTVKAMISNLRHKVRYNRIELAALGYMLRQQASDRDAREANGVN